MIDRLMLFLLIAGCLVFGAIIFLELEPAGSGAVAMSEVATIALLAAERLRPCAGSSAAR